MRQKPDIQELRARALRLIEETQVAGRNTRHSRADNLHAVRELVNGHQHYTFGIRGLEQCREEEVLDAIAAVTGCSKDPAVTTGGGYISPRATLNGLEQATEVIVRVARRGGRVVLGTGHPGSMLLYYIELGRSIEQWGGKLIRVEQGAFVPPHFDLEYVEGVAVLSDRCSIWHSHDTKPMEIIMGAARSIDLAVVDHGFAGAAINARIPVVGILDTNDPALAVARRMGAEIVLIPMDDNRPLHDYLPIIEIIREFAALALGQAPPQPRPAFIEQLARADRLVQERVGNVAALDQLAEDLAETYKDQFVQTHFDPEREEALVSDPYVVLATYRSLRRAIDRFIVDQVLHRRMGLTPEEIDRCLFERGASADRTSAA